MLKLLELLTGFDWLVAPRVVAERLWHDGGKGSAEFFLPVGQGWAGSQVQRLLGQHGIAMYGTFFAAGQLVFSVRAEDAARAQGIMQRHGVPLVYPGGRP